jgi:hypothetical protein
MPLKRHLMASFNTTGLASMRISSMRMVPPAVADVGIVVIAEYPYAEGEGDSNDLNAQPG